MIKTKPPLRLRHQYRPRVLWEQYWPFPWQQRLQGRSSSLFPRALPLLHPLQLRVLLPLPLLLRHRSWRRLCRSLLLLLFRRPRPLPRERSCVS